MSRGLPFITKMILVLIFTAYPLKLALPPNFLWIVHLYYLFSMRPISILPIFIAKLRNIEKCLLHRQERSWLSTWKQIHASVFNEQSEDGFVMIHIPKGRCWSGLTTFKIRSAFLKKKNCRHLQVSQGVPIEVQRNLYSASLRCSKLLNFVI